MYRFAFIVFAFFGGAAFAQSPADVISSLQASLASGNCEVAAELHTKKYVKKTGERVISVAARSSRLREILFPEGISDEALGQLTPELALAAYLRHINRAVGETGLELERTEIVATVVDSHGRAHVLFHNHWNKALFGPGPCPELATLELEDGRWRIVTTPQDHFDFNRFLSHYLGDDANADEESTSSSWDRNLRNTVGFIDSVMRIFHDDPSQGSVESDVPQLD